LICDGCAERRSDGRPLDRAGASVFGNASPQFVTSIAVTVAAIAPVAIHPSQRNLRPIAFSPMVSFRVASSKHHHGQLRQVYEERAVTSASDLSRRFASEASSVIDKVDWALRSINLKQEHRSGSLSRSLRRAA
jgi:hypothetical protein